jgi:multicomponent Na+:H+ antiporter subunit D
MDNLPVLQIVVPLMSAPVCLLIRERRLALGFGVAVCWSVFAMSVALLVRVLDTGMISYALGGWAPPWGIEYRIDTLNAFVLTFVSGIGAVVLTYAPASIEREIPGDRHYLFVTTYLLCLTGLLGIAITGDLFNLFVFLEISSLSSYGMIAMGRDRRALTAAFRYLILGTVGATFILIGIGLMYMMTGTLNMADMAHRLIEVGNSRTIIVAFAFLTVGISLKMALFPLHLWLPDAYTYAPSIVTAFLGGTATKVSVYVLLRFVFTVYGPGFGLEDFLLGTLLLPLSIVGIFFASTIAIFQTDLKRLLAYSSIAQVGYMVLGISLATVPGLTAGIVHMLNHALIKGGMFLAVGCIALHLGGTELERLEGVGKRMPLTMFLWTLGGLGLIGVPVTAGFVSKWYLITGALDRGWWPIAVLLLLSSLLAVVYVWRVVELAWFREPHGDTAELREAPLSMLLPTILLIGASIFFGLSTRWSVGVAERAARELLDPNPPVLAVEAPAAVEPADQGHGGGHP